RERLRHPGTLMRFFRRIQCHLSGRGLTFRSPFGRTMSRRSVLIVDDDADIREILAETLVQAGFEVTTACNGLEALIAVHCMTTKPPIILLDLMMPVMDGYAFLERRRADPRIASVPIVIVTAGHRVDRARLG